MRQEDQQHKRAEEQRGVVLDGLQGLRMTRARRGIIDILRSSSVPMTVEDILAALRENEPSVVLSTVYRNLDSLVVHGAVRRIMLPDGDRALFELASGPHRHYAVCLQCHRVLPLDGCPVEEYAKDAGRRLGFQVTEHSLVLYGYCRHCRSGR